MTIKIFYKKGVSSIELSNRCKKKFLQNLLNKKNIIKFLKYILILKIILTIMRPQVRGFCKDKVFFLSVR